MEITSIETERDHQRALKEIECLMAAEPNTPEGNRLEILVALVEAWEAEHSPLDQPATAA